MRQIKFRSAHYTYDDVFSHFSYWGKIDHLGQFTEDCFTSPSSSSKTIVKYNEQFTGLTDKNGKQIYEGDIVNVHRFKQILCGDYGVSEGEEESKCQVKIDTCGIEFHSNNDVIYFLDYCVNNDENQQVEVIGNIHENPELL